MPLLLTAAYHGRVDVPAVVARPGPPACAIDVRISDVLGPVSRSAAGRADPAAAGAPTWTRWCWPRPAPATRPPAPRSRAAAALSARPRRAVHGGLCLGGRPAGRRRRSRRFGRARVGVAAYFLAPGLLYDVAVASARAAGAVAVAPPLGDAPELVALVGHRVDATLVSASSPPEALACGLA